MLAVMVFEQLRTVLMTAALFPVLVPTKWP
jgi:hypothetical protein